ncbi:MAG: IS200/IS605 family transposase, partial [Anaerolineaceae bacterium]|nr:IS200/IS605 family transposase [Anaerolineaceae bacterium]
MIWATKYRRQIFTEPELVNDLKNILLRISFVSGVEIEEMEVMPDHVHLLISFKPKHAPTDIVK